MSFTTRDLIEKIKLLIQTSQKYGTAERCMLDVKDEEVARILNAHEKRVFENPRSSVISHFATKIK